MSSQNPDDSHQNVKSTTETKQQTKPTASSTTTTQPSLQDAINHADQFLSQLNTTQLPVTIKNVNKTSQQIHTTTYNCALSLNEALSSMFIMFLYLSLISWYQS
jgi:predicted PurR-regulated permease PerM